MPDLQDVPYDCRMGYPLDVLNARVAKFGATDPYIKQWLKSQARVLKACAGSATAADTTLARSHRSEARTDADAVR